MRSDDIRRPDPRVPTHWLERPIGQANMAALSVTAAAMFLLSVHEPEGSDTIAFARRSALLLMAVHGGFHALTINGLKLMALLEMAEAVPALRAYRDARRVSHLDLAALWLAYFALVPYITAV